MLRSSEIDESNWSSTIDGFIGFPAILRPGLTGSSATDPNINLSLVQHYPHANPHSTEPEPSVILWIGTFTNISIPAIWRRSQCEASGSISRIEMTKVAEHYVRCKPIISSHLISTQCQHYNWNQTPGDKAILAAESKHDYERQLKF